MTDTEKVIDKIAEKVGPIAEQAIAEVQTIGVIHLVVGAAVVLTLTLIWIYLYRHVRQVEDDTDRHMGLVFGWALYICATVAVAGTQLHHGLSKILAPTAHILGIK